MDVTRQPGWPEGANEGATTVQTASIRQSNSLRAGVTGRQSPENGGSTRGEGANDHFPELTGDHDGPPGPAVSWLLSRLCWEVGLGELRARHERRAAI